MRLPSQRTAATLVALAAGVLLLSMFLDWYRADLPSQIGGRAINVPTYNAFEALERSDVYLVVTAALTLIVAGLLLARVSAESPVPALVLVATGLFALALVIYRGTSRPARQFFGSEIDMTLRLGWFIALLAAASMALGGVLAYLAGPRLRLEADNGQTGAEPPGGTTNVGREGQAAREAERREGA